MRRQYKSCDQCRRSKRACDAPFFNDAANVPPLSKTLGKSNAATHPCSYCSKTRKKCTLEWATKLQRQNHMRPADGTTSKSRRQRTSLTELEGVAQDPQELLTLGCDDGPWIDIGLPVWLDGEGLVPELDTCSTLFDSSTLNIPPSDQGFGNLQFNPEPVAPPTVLDIFPSTLSEPSSLEYVNASDWSGNHWLENSDASHELRWDQAPPSLGSPGTVTSTWSDRNATTVLPGLHKQGSDPLEQTQLIRYSVSPFPANTSIANKFNNHFISSGLLKIYHDVLENNLTCWLTESTCPYKSGDTAIIANSSTRKEWGSMWSNRIYGRTLELDRAAIASGIVQISRSDDNAASRALDLVIVAFAAQWAQGSHRQTELYAEDASSSGMGPGNVGEEFDRKVQRELWEQARRALQQVSDVESFKVASAEVIFGLTQKPLDPPSDLLASTAADLFTYPNIGERGLKSRILAQLSALIATEGPPVYIERAARKLQALKARLDASCQRCGSDMYVCGSNKRDKRSFLSNENRATVNLLYWLAVMLDTISSSMHNRPVVVSDQESRQHSSADPNNQTSTLHSNGDTAIARWDVGNLIKDNLHEPRKIPTWPCSYEEAADAIIKSAPVKILLFRHIAYLQSMIRNGVRGKSVEELIETTTSVYRYWELTYGSFFRSLVTSIEVVPFRIQSWFSCISAHWHLAALMLADLIEFVDNNDLGTPFGKQCRTVMDIVATIREKTIRDLSDLATISTPGDEGGLQTAASDREGFHHAVNGCVILTEPWTLILIRAFGAASAILLDSAEQSINDNRELISKLAMAENCIKALWHLGKKSDLSRKCAEMLSVALNKLHVVFGAGQ